MNRDRAGEGHPSAEDMAAYVDGRIVGPDRERVEAHAAACPECRREIAEVTAMLARTRRRKSWQILAPAAAAAVIALLVLGPHAVKTGPDSLPRFRGPDSGAGAGPAEIHVASPPDEGVVGSDGLRFVWRSGAPGTSYQLTLTDVEGDVIWTVGTTDTVAALPDTMELKPASTYHWYVDALLEHGRFATSGVHSFLTRR